MAADMRISKWRNFVSWSAAGGLVLVAFVAVASWFGQDDPMGAILKAATNPRVALTLLLSMVLVGFSSQNTPFGWRRFRNFVIISAAAGAIAALAIAGIGPLVTAGTFGAMGVSQWTAAGVGLALLFLAVMVSFILVAARRSWTLLEVEQAETLRERGRLTFLSGIAMAATGAMLILLSLTGPGSVVSPAVALAGALVLFAVATAMSIAVWRLMDELDRTLSYEAGNMAFYLIVLLGGGWAMLAHLGFAAAPAALDWLTMFTVLMFAASFIAAARRKLLVP